MSITIEVPPDVEGALRDEAARHHVDAAEYGRRLLRAALGRADERKKPQAETRRKRSPDQPANGSTGALNSGSQLYNSGDDLADRLPAGFTDVDPLAFRGKAIDRSPRHEGERLYATDTAFANGLDERFRDNELVMTGRFVGDVWTLKPYNREAWEVTDPGGEILFVNHLEPRVDLGAELLRRWRVEGDADEQRETLEVLQRELAESRSSTGMPPP